MATVSLKPLRIPDRLELHPHELPPGHAHACAYVGTLPHPQFHVRLSMDNLRGSKEPQLVIQIFPRFSNPNPEHDAPVRPVSQMTDTFHQVTIPLHDPRKVATQDFNRATINRIHQKHAVALEGAAVLGEQFRKKENLVAIINAAILADDHGRGDAFADIMRLAKNALFRWNPSRTGPS